MEHFKTIIVGSGPAGSSCAKALTRNGMECLVLERQELPRPKTCSGLIYGQTQELLKKYFDREVPASLRCQPEFINAKNVYQWMPDNSLQPYTWELPKDGKPFHEDWINVWRDQFDFWLLQESAAQYKDGVYLAGYAVDGDTIRVTCKSRAGETLELSCDYLVGADGGGSTVRKLVDADGLKDAMACVTSYAYYGVEDPGKLQPGHWYVFLRKEFGDIIACIHAKDDTMALSVGGFVGSNLNQYEERFVASLETQAGVKFGPRKKRIGCLARLAPPCFGKNKILLAGDAGNFLYLNGEGISVAMDSGYRAGLAIVEADIKQDPNPAAILERNSQDILRHMKLCQENMNFVVGA